MLVVTSVKDIRSIGLSNGGCVRLDLTSRKRVAVLNDYVSSFLSDVVVVLFVLYC